MKLLSKIILEKESQINDTRSRNNSLTSEDTKITIKNKKEITSSPEKKDNNSNQWFGLY